MCSTSISASRPVIQVESTSSKFDQLSTNASFDIERYGEWEKGQAKVQTLEVLLRQGKSASTIEKFDLKSAA